MKKVYKTNSGLGYAYFIKVPKGYFCISAPLVRVPHYSIGELITDFESFEIEATDKSISDFDYGQTILDLLDRLGLSLPEKKEFTVHTLDKSLGDCSPYAHWSEGLTMYLSKDGQVMTIEGKEIRKVVNALPRTIGGTY